MNYGDCVGCGLCMIGCPAYEEDGFEAETAKGRNRMLQAGLQAPAMRAAIDACTLCGYCDAICPKHVKNIDILLRLRRDLNGPTKPAAPASHPLVLGCTIRERAPELVPSIQAFLRKLGKPADPEPAVCCGSKDVEAGRATPGRAKAEVVCDPVCLEHYDADFLGALAMRHLELFQLQMPFYYVVPHRLINRGLYYALYDGLRTSTSCDTNLDLNRLARSTSASAINPRDVEAAVKRLLRHSKAERVITCSPAEYLAFKAHSGRETLFITQCLR